MSSNVVNLVMNWLNIFRMPDQGILVVGLLWNSLHFHSCWDQKFIRGAFVKFRLNISANRIYVVILGNYLTCNDMSVRKLVNRMIIYHLILNFSFYFLLLAMFDGYSEILDNAPNIAPKLQSSVLMSSSVEVTSSMYNSAVSITGGVPSGTGNAALPHYNVLFIFAESNKLAKNLKRQYEALVSFTLDMVCFTVIC